MAGPNTRKNNSVKFLEYFKSRRYKQSLKKGLYNFRNLQDIMENGLEIALNSFVVFEMKLSIY